MEENDGRKGTVFEDWEETLTVGYVQQARSPGPDYSGRANAPYQLARLHEVVSNVPPWLASHWDTRYTPFWYGQEV